MRPAIAALVPGVQFMARPRLSELTYSGGKRLSRMPERSAIVGFSTENVYAIAELIRRTKGGCAVVMGALSPRTRNAQVDLYQNGDVDYLVATDAIGMGLNLDIKHIAFSSTVKFDGRRMRALFPQELAQIAGRAGRYMTSGTFGVTGEAQPLSDDTVEAIEEHRFLPVQKLSWRNEKMEFGTIPRLIAALERRTDDEWLSRARDADDVTALKTLSALPEIHDEVKTPQDVRLLWDVCRIPDFRGISTSEHASLLQGLYHYLRKGPIPTDWLAQQIKRIDRIEGDIDTLSKRLAFIRTWTYVAQRKNWVADESHWRDETRAVEDRLSDALHARLTQRFIDRRTSVLMRRLKQKESLVAEVNDKGEVTVEGEFVGRLEGFRFQQDATASSDEARTLRMAAVQALKPEFHLRSDKFYNAPDTELDFTEQGGLMWGSSAIGKLVAGADALRPSVEAFVDEDAGPEVAEKVKRRLQHFIDRKVATLFEPLLAMSRDEALTGMARGFAFQLVEALGVLPRENVAEEVKALDQEARGQLRKHGIRFGQYTIFQQLLLKPAPTRLRLVLWSLANGLQEFPESPPPGLVTIPNITEVPKQHYTLAGYHPAGSRAIRIDMLERLADLLRGKDSRGGFEATPDMLSITGMTLEQFGDLMAGLGYKGEKGERPKTKAAAPKELTAEDIAAAAAAAAAAAKIKVPEEAAPEEVAAETPPEASGEISGEAMAEAPAENPDAPAEPVAEPVAEPMEMESFITFVWAPRPRGGDRRPPRRDNRAAQGATKPEASSPDQGDAQGDAPREGGKPRGERPAGQGQGRGKERGGQDRGPRPEGGFKGKGGGKPQGKPGGKPGGRPPQNGPQKYEARPPRPEKKIDPDNPFAALAALKGKI
jgi:ATP-dependent RNA helicase SUPV3L1/SUV3